MTILVTGFDPFGGESINPAYEAVKLLPDDIGGAAIVKQLIPTSFSCSGRVIAEAIERLRPDAVVCVGQAGGRAAIKEAGVNAALSLSAGTFVCNSLMYRVLYLAAKRYPGMRGGFIHVPYLTEQTVGKRPGTPGMEMCDIVKGLTAAISVVAQQILY